MFSAPPKLVQKLLGWPAGRALCFQYGLGFYRFKLERKQTDGKQYRQRKGTVNRIYIPRILPNGDAVIKDPTVPKIITEGEKKAIKGCQEGLVVVALPRVYGFLHKGEPIPELDRFTWDGCRVEIVFDSDPSEQSKGQVDKARRWLASVLTVRGADVWAVILPDDGKEKVGLDDYLLTHSIDEFLALPRTRVPCYSSLTNSNGGSRKSYVTPDVERLIWNRLLKKSPSDFEPIPDFDDPVRTVLNTGMKGDHLTSRVPGKNGRDSRIRVGKQTFAYVMVYYNLLRRAVRPKGRYKMVMPRRKDIPVWQGLMELEAGVELPDEYRPHLPACAPQAAIDVKGAWLRTAWVRHREYPGCSVVFDPEMISLMLSKPRSYVLSGWQWLENYDSVDAVYVKDSTGRDRELFRPGENPIEDPEGFDRMMEEMKWGDAIIPQKSDADSGNILGSQPTGRIGDNGCSAPSSLTISNGEVSGEHSEVSL